MMWQYKILFSLIIFLILGGTQAQTGIYNEAPILAEQVARGELPPIDERLPIIPVVIQPVESIGQYGGIWNVGIKREGDSYGIFRNIGYENLVRWDPTWTRVVPNIASSVTSNADATEYTFTLRQGMRWSDGALFTADDILFWYEAVFSNESLVQNYPLLRDPTYFINGNRMTVEKIDDLTVVFRFASPYGLFLRNLASPYGGDPSRFPRHYLQEFHPSYNPNAEALAQAAGFQSWQEYFVSKVGDEVGGLTYETNPDLPRLDAWVLTTGYGPGPTEGESLVATRNPYYWKVDTDFNQLPYIDEVHFLLADSAADVQSLALTGVLGMQERFLDVSHHQDEFRTAGYETFTALPSTSNFLSIQLNLNHPDPILRDLFQNRDFRIALSHGINRELIINTVGLAGIPYQVAPLPESPYFNEQLAYQYLEYDPALANSILDSLGLSQRNENDIRLRSDGQPLSFSILARDGDAPSTTSSLTMLQQQWTELGIEVNIELVDLEAFTSYQSRVDFDAINFTGAGGIDVAIDMRDFAPVAADSYYALDWANWYLNRNTTTLAEPPAPVVQQMALYDELIATSDPTRQSELISQILVISAEQFYVMGISTPEPRLGIYRSDFMNVPRIIPAAWIYPSPAPVNPSQFYIVQN